MNARIETSATITGRPVYTATIRKGPALLWTQMFLSEAIALATTQRKVSELEARP